MKKLYTLSLLLLAFMAKAQVITIPDANFKAKLLAAAPSNSIASNGLANIKIDVNDNNEIELNEALLVINLNVSIAEIHNISGIGAFTNLRSLNCSQNHIPSLDLSPLTNLKSLNCSLNVLTSLHLIGLTHLQHLNCAENTLTQIDFANATSLQTLSCRFNFLTSLQVNGLTNLLSLNCDYNQLTVLNIGNLTQLTDLACQSNQFTTLDLSTLVNLTSLNCSFNQLSALDLTGLDGISTLNCAHNQLTSLFVGNLANLQLLNCEVNQISNTLELYGMDNLQSVYCQHNNIPVFGFGLPSLEVLDCSSNQASYLDLNDLPLLSVLNCSGNTLLTDLKIKNNSLEAFLDFSNNPNLVSICADEGQLSDIQNLINQYGYTSCQVSSTCNLGTSYFEHGNEVSILPNPTTQILNLETKGTVNSVFIYNTVGQLLQANTSPDKTIDVSALKQGTYFIKVNTDRGSISTKFIKK